MSPLNYCRYRNSSHAGCRHLENCSQRGQQGYLCRALQAKIEAGPQPSRVRSNRSAVSGKQGFAASLSCSSPGIYIASRIRASYTSSLQTQARYQRHTCLPDQSGAPRPGLGPWPLGPGQARQRRWRARRAMVSPRPPKPPGRRPAPASATPATSSRISISSAWLPPPASRSRPRSYN
jgi:hypothetical protein